MNSRLLKAVLSKWGQVFKQNFSATFDLVKQMFSYEVCSLPTLQLILVDGLTLVLVVMSFGLITLLVGQSVLDLTVLVLGESCNALDKKIATIVESK